MTENFAAAAERELSPLANAVNKRKPTKRFNKMYLFCWVGASIPLLGFLLFSGFPLVVSFMAMFSDMERNNIDTMQWNDFANFIRFATDERVWIALRNTAILACSQFVSLLVAIAIAAFLSQNVKGSRLFQTLFFIPYICSTVAIAVMWNNIFGIKGALNAILNTNIEWLNNMENPYSLTKAIFVAVVWKAPGYGIVMYCSAFKAINPALYEAASLDGANAWHKFRNITLPGNAPITFFLVLSGLLARLSIFDVPTIMAPLSFDGHAGPEDAGLTMMYCIYVEGVQFSNMGYASVMSWFLFLITAIPSVYFIRKRMAEVEEM